jgi:hypothetical protein
MTLRFYHRVTLIPGLRVNLSRSGASLSIGHRGIWYTIGPKGQRATIGLPGSGVYWTKQYPPAHPHGAPPTHVAPPLSRPIAPPTCADQAAFLIVVAVMVGLVILAAAFAGH